VLEKATDGDLCCRLLPRLVGTLRDNTAVSRLTRNIVIETNQVISRTVA